MHSLLVPIEGEYCSFNALVTVEGEVSNAKQDHTL